jgi:N-acetylmuramoyl-L-alanine amidase
MTKLICICAGHDSNRPGVAVGTYKEEVMATLLRDRIYNSLVAQGVAVIRDGQDGQNLPLRDAIRLANKADLAIDLHFNASANATATGIEALCHPAHKKIAQELCESLNRTMGLRLRGEKGWKPADSGHHSKLGFCEAGGIVLEVCFLTNDLDRKAYLTNKMQVAGDLADTIARYAL